MAAREQLVLVTRNLPPLRGGMERLNWHLATELGWSYDVTVLGPPGAAEHFDGHFPVLESPRSSIASFLVWSAITAPRICRQLSPGWVVGGSGVLAPVIAVAAAVSGARPAVFLHGLDIVARHLAYRAAWLPAIRRQRLCMVNSNHTAALARAAGVEAGRIEVVFPGVELPREVTVAAKTDFRRRFSLDGTILLSVGRLTNRKGLAEFIEHALPNVVRDIPDAVLVVIGDDAPDALLRSHSGQRARVNDVITRLNLQSHVRFLGPVDDNTLAIAYASADVHVFPVREVPGDVEGFGMVAIEAAAQGLPTVAFAVGGIPDAVQEGVSGSLVPPGDYPALSQAIVRTVRTGSARFAAGSVKFAAGLGWDRFGRGVVGALRARESR